jgi:Ca2+-binding EF-hand superfamily protein
MSLLTTIGGAASAWTTPLARAFARVDSNGDGKVDKTELQTTFDANAAKAGREARDADKVIARIDRDGDGEISRVEARARVHDLRAAPSSTLELAARDSSR